MVYGTVSSAPPRYKRTCAGFLSSILIVSSEAFPRNGNYHQSRALQSLQLWVMFNNRMIQRWREIDEHQGPLLVPNPHASPGSAGLWPASSGGNRSLNGARPTNIRGHC